MKNRKKYSISTHSTILYISIIALTLISIMSISYGMIKPRTILNIPDNYTSEQIELIKIANSNNTGDSVSNIIATATIFFTVLVVVISVFQFIKSKEVDSIINSLDEKMQKYDNKINLYDKKVIEINENIEEQRRLQLNLEKNIDIQNIYLNLMRAEMECHTHPESNQFFIDMYSKCINTLNKYEHLIIEEYEVSRLYNHIGVAYVNLKDYDNGEYYMKKSLGYKDEVADEVSKRIQLASLFNIRSNYEETLKYIMDAKAIDTSINKIHFGRTIKRAVTNELHFLNILKDEKYKILFKEVSGIYLSDNFLMIDDKRYFIFDFYGKKHDVTLNDLETNYFDIKNRLNH